MGEEKHRKAKRREAVVLAFLALEKDGRVKRTDASIESALNDIKVRAAVFCSQRSAFDKNAIDPDTLIMPKAGVRSVRRWLSAYEKLGLPSLNDAIENRGNRQSRLRPDELALMSRVVGGYLDDRKPSISTIYENVRKEFDEENRRRGARGAAELVAPSRETVRVAVRSLDPFRCDLSREGSARARNKYAPVGKGLDLTRPLQRVELDTWKVDLMTLAAASGLSHFMSDEDKARLGLDNQKTRWHLTVAICATTRCILAMRLCRAPNAQATLQTIEMMLREKGVWSDAVGALSPWAYYGTPELVVMDCGTENTSLDVRLALRDLGIRVEHAPAGLPEMRARIERFFGTLSIGLTPRLTGRTFSSMIEKGDYDPQARAALTADDLCAAIIRWVVDIYHRSPHSGLGGETPSNCWRRLTEQFGICPAPDLRRQRLALGTRLKRTVSKAGITVFGVRYHSDVLANWMLRAKRREVHLRWYGEDLGAIAVELDGKWFEVPAAVEGFQGVRAQTWLAAARELRARFRREASVDEEVVLDAIRAIDQINGDAMQRMGLLAQDWSEERVQQEEARLLIGFNILERASATTTPGLRFGDEMPTAAGDNIDETEPEAPRDNISAKSRDSVSGSTASTADPVGQAAPNRGDDEDPGFELEDKW